MAREALTSFSSSCSTYYDIKPTMIIYIVIEVAMNGLFDINLSIYTYLWSEECMDNLFYVGYVHIIDIWKKMKYGMNWKWSVFTLIRDHFAFIQNRFLWTNRYLQSIYPYPNPFRKPYL